ncbi:hypothetical protein, partial [Neisseria sicca]|uniref:hypothetical protein n=1 Tax=Neisseria sicca TaxID=490 RepID=UPI001C9955C3
DFLEGLFMKGACGGCFDLLEIVGGFEMGDKQEGLEGGEMGWCGNDMEGKGDGGVVGIGEIGEEGFGLLGVLDDLGEREKVGKIAVERGLCGEDRLEG